MTVDHTIRYRYRDMDGDELAVRRSIEGESMVYLAASDGGVVLPPEELPKLVASLYRATGQEPPIILPRPGAAQIRSILSPPDGDEIRVTAWVEGSMVVLASTPGGRVHPHGARLRAAAIVAAADLAENAPGPEQVAAMAKVIDDITERRPPMRDSLAAYCPMGCGRTLFVADGGFITCSYVHCPRPTAVADLLEDRETEHIVRFGLETFTVRHPLRERLDESLMDCALHDHVKGLAGPPIRPGQYRARARTDGQGWTWEPLPDPQHIEGVATDE
ncbi:DUF6085 family protein [Sphaerisporangium sp. NPDC051011]|uniref:DUF6085 family protein n=1 Tax=Sphaerisporangium sp. NPDC051011 TaxID=3155792 RepID=UPI0033DA46B1